MIKRNQGTVIAARTYHARNREMRLAVLTHNIMVLWAYLAFLQSSLDPFAGNQNDPQSLHKYLYTHGNPVMGIDPSGLMTLNTKLATISVISLMTAIGGGVGYYTTGTVKGTLYGGIAGAGFGVSLVLYKHDPTLYAKAIGLGIASMLVGTASYLGDQLELGRDINDTEIIEAALKGLAVSNVVLAGTGLLKAGQEKLIASFYNQHQFFASVIASTTIELTKSIIDGRLKTNPKQVLAKIATSTITNYLTLKLGFSPRHAGVASFASARVLEAFGDIYSEFSQ